MNLSEPRVVTLHQEDRRMLKWAMIFLVMALVLGLLGFGGLAGAFMQIAKILFWLAITIFAILLVLVLTAYKKNT